MGKKNRQTRFPDDAAAETSPFAELAKLRGSLPEGESEPEDESSEAPKFAAKVVIRKERAGRGGKTVTVIQGVEMVGEERDDFVRGLRKALGTSGNIEGELIVLGGDVSSRTAKLLEEAGARNIVMGT